MPIFVNAGVKIGPKYNRHTHAIKQVKMHRADFLFLKNCIYVTSLDFFKSSFRFYFILEARECNSSCFRSMLSMPLAEVCEPARTLGANAP